MGSRSGRAVVASVPVVLGIVVVVDGLREVGIVVVVDRLREAGIVAMAGYAGGSENTTFESEQLQPLLRPGHLPGA